jgi:AMMECR1 domain-containing protein
MHQLVRKTLETYLDEKRIITQSDIPADMLPMMSTRQSVFVTLYMDGRVIASSGRIQCQKENTLYEIIDATMLCLKDSRFASNLQSSENLSKIHIRVDTFASEDRRMIQSVAELNIRDE